ncbi:MAG TPA: TetR/AcrR family transcriptional regulator, partial [Mycobacterium sp.]|nr:TetR/AcrR family transcriptional regulator [Mycobacterium sp.]
LVVVADTGVNAAAADLPFRLVESLVNMRSVPAGPDSAELPFHVADACLRVLGINDTSTPALRQRTNRELERYTVVG